MLLLFPLLVFSDLNWSWFDPHLLSTCSMDQFIYIWDLRSEGGVDNSKGSRAGVHGGSVAPPPQTTQQGVIWLSSKITKSRVTTKV